MPQHDMVVQNAPGLTWRSDINAALAALVTFSSGEIEPPSPKAGMLWLDTSILPDGALKMRNQANASWIPLQLATPPVVRQVGVAGADTIVNGTFATDTDWTKGSGITIAGGVAVFTATTNALSQAQTLVAGTEYKIVYTVAGRSAGGVFPTFLGGTTVLGTTVTANGTYTNNLIAAAGNNTLAFQASGASATLTIDNVTLQAITASTSYAAMTFPDAVSNATNSSNAVFPIGTVVVAANNTATNRCVAQTVRLHATATLYETTTGAGTTLAGTWRHRALITIAAGNYYSAFQRVA